MRRLWNFLLGQVRKLDLTFTRVETGIIGETPFIKAIFERKKEEPYPESGFDVILDYVAIPNARNAVNIQGEVQSAALATRNRNRREMSQFSDDYKRRIVAFWKENKDNPEYNISY